MNDANILFSSRFNLLKIYDSDTTDVSVATILPPFDPSLDYILATHGLGYVPRARVWYEPVAGEIWPMTDKQFSNSDGGPGTTLSLLGSYYLTSSGLYVRIRYNSTAGSKRFYWRIYADE